MGVAPGRSMLRPCIVNVFHSLHAPPAACFKDIDAAIAPY
jgi:hypothetical protein